MTWVYLENLLCSPGPAADCSEADCSAGDPSAPSSTTPTDKPSSSRAKRTASSILSRSGRTLEISTDARGVEKWISSLPDSRANRSASPGNAKPPATNETGGPTLSGPFARWDRVTRGWKTCKDCSPPRNGAQSSPGIPSNALCLGEFGSVTRRLSDLLDISGLFLGTWPKRGLMRNGVCWERTTSAPITGGNDCGCWHTPLATDARGEMYQYSNGDHSKPTATLCGQVRGMFPTPRVTPGGPDYARANRPGSGGDTLATAVAREKFPTPRVEDGQCAGPHRGKPDSLHSYTKMFPTPNKMDAMARAKQKGGCSNLKDTITGGQLNPTWVEWLMGWPIGWTDLRPLETDRFQRWLELLGYY